MRKHSEASPGTPREQRETILSSSPPASIKPASSAAADAAPHRPATRRSSPAAAGSNARAAADYTLGSTPTAAYPGIGAVTLALQYPDAPGRSAERGHAAKHSLPMQPSTPVTAMGGYVWPPMAGGELRARPASAAATASFRDPPGAVDVSGARGGSGGASLLMPQLHTAATSGDLMLGLSPADPCTETDAQVAGAHAARKHVFIAADAGRSSGAAAAALSSLPDALPQPHMGGRVAVSAPAAVAVAAPAPLRGKAAAAPDIFAAAAAHSATASLSSVRRPDASSSSGREGANSHSAASTVILLSSQQIRAGAASGTKRGRGAGAPTPGSPPSSSAAAAAAAATYALASSSSSAAASAPAASAAAPTTSSDSRGGRVAGVAYDDGEGRSLSPISRLSTSSYSTLQTPKKARRTLSRLAALTAALPAAGPAEEEGAAQGDDPAAAAEAGAAPASSYGEGGGGGTGPGAMALASAAGSSSSSGAVAGAGPGGLGAASAAAATALEERMSLQALRRDLFGVSGLLRSSSSSAAAPSASASVGLALGASFDDGTGEGEDEEVVGGVASPGSPRSPRAEAAARVAISRASPLPLAYEGEDEETRDTPDALGLRDALAGASVRATPPHHASFAAAAAPRSAAGARVASSGAPGTGAVRPGSFPAPRGSAPPAASPARHAAAAAAPAPGTSSRGPGGHRPSRSGASAARLTSTAAAGAVVSTSGGGGSAAPGPSGAHRGLGDGAAAGVSRRSLGAAAGGARDEDSRSAISGTYGSSVISGGGGSAGKRPNSSGAAAAAAAPVTASPLRPLQQLLQSPTAGAGAGVSPSASSRLRREAGEQQQRRQRPRLSLPRGFGAPDPATFAAAGGGEEGEEEYMDSASAAAEAIAAADAVWFGAYGAEGTPRDGGAAAAAGGAAGGTNDEDPSGGGEVRGFGKGMAVVATRSSFTLSTLATRSRASKQQAAAAAAATAVTDSALSAQRASSAALASRSPAGVAAYRAAAGAGAGGGAASHRRGGVREGPAAGAASRPLTPAAAVAAAEYSSAGIKRRGGVAASSTLPPGPALLTQSQEPPPLLGEEGEAFPAFSSSLQPSPAACATVPGYPPPRGLLVSPDRLPRPASSPVQLPAEETEGPGPRSGGEMEQGGEGQPRLLELPPHLPRHSGRSDSRDTNAAAAAAAAVSSGGDGAEDDDELGLFSRPGRAQASSSDGTAAAAAAGAGAAPVASEAPLFLAEAAPAGVIQTRNQAKQGNLALISHHPSTRAAQRGTHGVRGVVKFVEGAEEGGVCGVAEGAGQGELGEGEADGEEGGTSDAVTDPHSNATMTATQATAAAPAAPALASPSRASAPPPSSAASPSSSAAAAAGSPVPAPRLAVPVHLMPPCFRLAFELFCSLDSALALLQRRGSLGSGPAAVGSGRGGPGTGGRMLPTLEALRTTVESGVVSGARTFDRARLATLCGVAPDAFLVSCKLIGKAGREVPAGAAGGVAAGEWRLLIEPNPAFSAPRRPSSSASAGSSSSSAGSSPTAPAAGSPPFSLTGALEARRSLFHGALSSLLWAAQEDWARGRGGSRGEVGAPPSSTAAALAAALSAPSSLPRQQQPSLDPAFPAASVPLPSAVLPTGSSGSVAAAAAAVQSAADPLSLRSPGGAPQPGTPHTPSSAPAPRATASLEQSLRAAGLNLRLSSAQDGPAPDAGRVMAAALGALPAGPGSSRRAPLQHQGSEGTGQLREEPSLLGRDAPSAAAAASPLDPAPRFMSIDDMRVAAGEGRDYLSDIRAQRRALTMIAEARRKELYPASSSTSASRLTPGRSAAAPLPIALFLPALFDRVIAHFSSGIQRYASGLGAMAKAMESPMRGQLAPDRILEALRALVAASGGVCEVVDTQTAGTAFRMTSKDQAALDSLRARLKAGAEVARAAMGSQGASGSGGGPGEGSNSSRR